MLKKKGDLFTSTAPAIGHGVNVQGVMGAGIAKAFKEKFPKNYVSYRNACQTGLFRVGEAMINSEDGKYIVNLSTQENPGPEARYIFVLHAGMQAAETLLDLGVNRLAVPLIGCGIGGLDWDRVEKIMLTVEILNPGFEFEVWKL